VGLRFLVRLRFALRSLAVWRVRAIAPSFIFGWRAFSSARPAIYKLDTVLCWIDNRNALLHVTLDSKGSNDQSLPVLLGEMRLAWPTVQRSSTMYVQTCSTWH
jgi:hypothetical protein